MQTESPSVAGVATAGGTQRTAVVFRKAAATWLGLRVSARVRVTVTVTVAVRARVRVRMRVRARVKVC